jgi:hypothetical protein
LASLGSCLPFRSTFLRPAGERIFRGRRRQARPRAPSCSCGTRVPNTRPAKAGLIEPGAGTGSRQPGTPHARTALSPVPRGPARVRSKQSKWRTGSEPRRLARSRQIRNGRCEGAIGWMGMPRPAVGWPTGSAGPLGRDGVDAARPHHRCL